MVHKTRQVTCLQRRHVFRRGRHHLSFGSEAAAVVVDVVTQGGFGEEGGAGGAFDLFLVCACVCLSLGVDTRRCPPEQRRQSHNPFIIFTSAILASDGLLNHPPTCYTFTQSHMCLFTARHKDAYTSTQPRTCLPCPSSLATVVLTRVVLASDKFKSRAMRPMISSGSSTPSRRYLRLRLLTFVCVVDGGGGGDSCVGVSQCIAMCVGEEERNIDACASGHNFSVQRRRYLRGNTVRCSYMGAYHITYIYTLKTLRSTSAGEDKNVDARAAQYVCACGCVCFVGVCVSVCVGTDRGRTRRWRPALFSDTEGGSGDEEKEGRERLSPYICLARCLTRGEKHRLVHRPVGKRAEPCAPRFVVDVRGPGVCVWYG